MTAEKTGLAIIDTFEESKLVSAEKGTKRDYSPIEEAAGDNEPIEMAVELDIKSGRVQMPSPLFEAEE